MPAYGVYWKTAALTGSSNSMWSGGSFLAGPGKGESVYATGIWTIQRCHHRISPVRRPVRRDGRTAQYAAAARRAALGIGGSGQATRGGGAIPAQADGARKRAAVFLRPHYAERAPPRRADRKHDL